MPREANWRARGVDMTEERYDQLLSRQDGVCAICGNPPKTRRLAVDHDHKTGQTRGLLCYRCNRLLLMRGVTADLLGKAALYLNFYALLRESD